MIQLLTETRLHPDFPLSRSELPQLMEEILEVFGLEQSFLTLRLVDDAEIARLNKAFLGCFGPTNVLSFPAREFDDQDFKAEESASDGNATERGVFSADAVAEGAAEEDDGPYLGEIALSVDTLARETRLYGQTPREHLVRLLAHATLHLAGLDHGPEMEAMTEAALDALA
ncbi:MAG: rRNA maturation RNase YbeY [Desulfovibrio sp.]